ncbi:MAG: hypothetical protein OEY29_07720 [Gammaproteobacteria bacterium]|nr:hypothetical protein [Gammaproteobacteria bacterium]
MNLIRLLFCKFLLSLNLGLCSGWFFYTHAAEVQPLNIISSANPESNKVHSFIYVDSHSGIEQGVKKTTQSSALKIQIPFVVDLPVNLKADETLQWLVRTSKLETGEIEILSKYPFTKETMKSGYEWVSGYLQNDIQDHSRLVFRPLPLKHKEPVYKKGRGGNGRRQRYGGGTPEIDDEHYNPRLSYQIIANIRKSSGEILSYQGKIEMDNKDMVRQEYINHYRINRYGRGGYGDLPVPLREELSSIPDIPAKLLGTALSESSYGLMIDDGLTELAIRVVSVFEAEKEKYKANGSMMQDLNNNALPVPKSELWLSGGWRNPERNEWFSNALNGVHQRGGAIDIVANEPPSDTRSAIVYWFLWKALEASQLEAFWQLETNGRPMVTREFEEDIEPKNGIPDAFDKADHMHINIKYE